MLTEIFTAAYAGRRMLNVCFMKAAKNITLIICPAEDYNKLLDCYRDSQRLAEKVFKITESPNKDVGFLCDFFEMRPDGFQSYSDLASFWAEANAAFPIGSQEREEHPKAFPILWAAKSFSLGFQGLPKATQFFLNASLALPKALLIETIERSSIQSNDVFAL